MQWRYDQFSGICNRIKIHYDGTRGAENDHQDNSNLVKVDATHSHTVTIGATGGNGLHENRQPYTVVNFWRRTA